MSGAVSLEPDAWDLVETYDYQAHVDRVRLLGFVMALGRSAAQLNAELDDDVDALVDARRKAEATRDRLLVLLDLAETASRAAASGDRILISSMAKRLEEWFG